MNTITEQMFMANATESQPSSSTERHISIPENTPVNLENVSDFSNVCRTCATITEFVIPIFSGEGLQNNLADKIHKHLPIGVSESDVLPRVVCYQCASTLLAWHELVQCCVQADQALRAKIAADTRTQNAGKTQKSTNQKSLLAMQDDTQSKYNHMTDYVVSNMAPPAYSPPTRRCDYCDVKLPEAIYKEHLGKAHSDLVFFCQECDSYKSKRDFLRHMTRHATQYTANPILMKRLKRVAGDVTQNAIRPKSPKSDTISTTEESRSPKNNDQNDFSDHSDTEDGFGPLPDSVFKAIEDSQDSQSAISRYTPVVDSQNEESNNSEPSNEENTSKTLRKRTRTCPVCGKVYTASSSYFYHMKYSHRQIKDHACTTCGKKFATKANLRIHLATHTETCEFECKECNKRFKSNAGLYIHQQTHTGVKTWSCRECHRCFRWKTHLLRHMKRHSAEKAHVCSVCGRGFSVHCDLLRHMRTHNAGNFSCDKCDTKFAQLRYLKVHVQNKHSGKAKKS